MPKVELLVKTLGRKRGEVVSVSDKTSKRLIANGHARSAEDAAEALEKELGVKGKK